MNSTLIPLPTSSSLREQAALAAGLPHPRLLATAEDFAHIAERRQQDALLHRFLLRSQQDAEALLTRPAATYNKYGNRLLYVSRQVLGRVISLGLHYRLSGREEFAQRAITEMMAAAHFPDWCLPPLCLDIAEMTAALAIGYDWLYDAMDAEQRATIRQAIVEKGLSHNIKPGYEWLTGRHNWNQVCLGSLLLGALALAEDEEELTAEIFDLVRTYNVNGLMPYQPAGVYPEGTMYWSYGTSYQVVILSALQSALKDDWGLSQSPGFMESAAAILQLIAPSGRTFNFSDSLEGFHLESPLFWFAKRLEQPHLLHHQRKLLQDYIASPPSEWENSDYRFLPLAALWWPQDWESDNDASLPPRWFGPGANPLGVFRSSWETPEATYLAFKGGQAFMSHAHMDAGTFVFEAGGVRWAIDLGAQDYHSLESRGVGMWNFNQDGERWDVFRLGNLSHNTLTINGGRYAIRGKADITHFDAEAGLALVDLTGCFESQATKVLRGYAFESAGGAVIRDELQGLQPNDEVRWAMVTNAAVEVSGSTAHLTQDGKQLDVEVLSPAGVRLEVLPVEKPVRPYDAPNPNTRILAIKADAPDSGDMVVSVRLTLQGAAVHGMWADIALKDWDTVPATIERKPTA